MAKKSYQTQAKISGIEITDDTISGRGGLFFFLKFVEGIGFYQLVERRFAFLKGSGKGLNLRRFLKQILAHFVDGTDPAMVGFDRRKQDSAYAALLEVQPDELASSHQMKRFFRKLQWIGNSVYRWILGRLFLWRLHLEQPERIILFADSKVFDNDDAQKREGVEPTYRKVKGYHPLHIIWKGYVVDAIFRPGSQHSNHGDDFIKAIRRLVRLIRKGYRDVPIIVVTDSAFLDQDHFDCFEKELGIFYVCVGKLYEDIKTYVGSCAPETFSEWSNGHQLWTYLEFGNRLKSWSRFRRCIFTSPKTEENGQLIFEFARKEEVIYTNIGLDEKQTARLVEAKGKSYLRPEGIIQLCHQRGKDELTHRALAEFATKEQFPFLSFGMNRAYYYLLVLSFFLYEAYKRDLPGGIVGESCYPNTFRRVLIDFAVKIVRKAGRTILKIPRTIWNKLQIHRLWEWIGGLEPLPCARG